LIEYNYQDIFILRSYQKFRTAKEIGSDLRRTADWVTVRYKEICRFEAYQNKEVNGMKVESLIFREIERSRVRDMDWTMRFPSGLNRKQSSVELTLSKSDSSAFEGQELKKYYQDHSLKESEKLAFNRVREQKVMSYYALLIFSVDLFIINRRVLY